MYISIGVFGALAITNNCIEDISKVELINECYSTTNAANLVIILTYAFNLITSFPIYYRIMKMVLFNILNYDPPKKVEYALNIGFLIFCSIIKNIPGMNTDILMNLNGAVACFFVAYVLPIALHLKCYHGQNKLVNFVKKSISRIGLIKKEKYTED